nr:hypothetical protein [uncultured Aminipila sp.]
MVKIRISYENEAEKNVILAALDPVVQPKAIKGYKGQQPFQRAYITAEIKSDKC